MSRIYLLSNGPDRAYVSCFDSSKPAERRLVRLTPEGILLESEDDLSNPQWRRDMMARLPEAYRQEPDRWFIACSRSRFFKTRRTEYEERLNRAGYENVKLISAADAVLAYYRDQQDCLVSSTAVLTLDQNGISAERFLVSTYYPDYLDETDTSFSVSIDEALVRLQVNPDLLTSESYVRHLSRAMWKLRHTYLEDAMAHDFEDRPRTVHVSGDSLGPDASLTVSADFLQQAAAWGEPSLQTQIQQFLTETDKRWAMPLERTSPNFGPVYRPIGAILCSGEDWYMEPVMEVLDRTFQRSADLNGSILLSGAHEAVIRGMELLAVPMLAMDAMERQWHSLCYESSALISALDSLFYDYGIIPCQSALDTGAASQKALDDWTSLKYRKDKLRKMTRQYIQDSVNVIHRTWHFTSKDAYDDLLHRLRDDLRNAAFRATGGAFVSPHLDTLFDDIDRALPDTVLSQWSDNIWPLESHLTESADRFQDFYSGLSDQMAFLDSSASRRSQLDDSRDQWNSLRKELYDDAVQCFDSYLGKPLQTQGRRQFVQQACNAIRADLRKAFQAALGIPALELIWFFDEWTPAVTDSVLNLIKEDDRA